MLASIQTIALFGFAAVNAAPMPQVSSTNWDQVWKAEEASMVSVQNAMGKGTGAPAGPTSTPVVVLSSTVRQTSTVTATPSQAPVSTPSQTGGASSSSASSSAAPSSTGGSTSGGSGSGATVTNQQAFQDGAATKSPSTTAGVSSVSDGNYKCYSGAASAYPSSDKWGSFDTLWTNNVPLIKESCTNLGDGADPTTDQIQDMHDGILQVAGDSFVDPRFILAIIMQESHGCVNVGTTSNGVSNPGIMQSHNGVSFNAADAKNSIVQMIRDGTQGTSSGDGLVQLINKYGDVYEAARGYNSGTVTPGNLNQANGATASYVDDIANRLTGWVMNPGTSPTC